jgi:hypothetical protein
MRNVLIIPFIMSVFAGSAVAQVPTSGNVFFGYSYYNTDLLSIDRANTNGGKHRWKARCCLFLASQLISTVTMVRRIFRASRAP